MPDFTVPISLLKKPIEKVAEAASGALKTKIQALKADGKVEALHSKLWQIQRVKTIWNPDRPLALSTIYFPVSINYEIEGEQINRQVDGLTQLHHRHCLLEGTAGQGKSILLKYLVGKEIRSGERVPVLFELRNYAGGSLQDALARRFCEFLGISEDSAIFSKFCERGAVSLLLDGLDEVDPVHVQALLTGVESISQKYPSTWIVLTTRPGSGGEALSLFSSVRINQLAREQLPEFLKKITKDNVFSKKLVTALRSSPIGVQYIITTPLAATLLAIIYRAAGRIPAEFTEFFEELFHVLVARHDASKLGWRRHRLSGLSDRQLQFAFEAYCFQVRRRRAVSCSVEESIGFAREGLKQAEIQGNPETCLHDLKKITCLIIEEGRRLEFVHASVANYFASKFIKSLSDSAAQRFYNHLLEKNWQQWLAELDFLRDIDNVRLVEHFLLPDVERTLAEIDTDAKLAALVDSVMGLATLSKRRDSTGAERFYADHGYVARTYSSRDFSQTIFKKIYIENIESVVPWSACPAVRTMPLDSVLSWGAIADSRGGVVRQKVLEEMAIKRWSLGQQRDELRSLVERSRDTSSIFTI